MQRIACFAVVFALVGIGASQAHPESLVAEGAKVQKLASGFKFTEGPAVDAKGNIYFSDIPNNRTHVWSIEGKLSTFRESTGGGNGMIIDREGNVLTCEGTARRGRVALAVTRQGSHRPGRAHISASGSSADSFAVRPRSYPIDLR